MNSNSSSAHNTMRSGASEPVTRLDFNFHSTLKAAQKILRQTDPYDRTIAFHEAGHALVASLLDIPVVYVMVRDSRKGLKQGYCANPSTHAVTRYSVEFLRDALLPQAAAGEAAELLRSRDIALQTITAHARLDRGDGEYIINQLQTLYILAYYEGEVEWESSYDDPWVVAVARATRLLKANRDKLTLLAGTLVARQYLNGRDMERIINSRHQVFFKAHSRNSPKQPYYFKFGKEGQVVRAETNRGLTGPSTYHATLREAMAPLLLGKDNHDESTPPAIDPDYWASKADLRSVFARLKREAK